MVVTIIEGGELSYTLARIFLLFNNSVNIIGQTRNDDMKKFNEIGANAIYGSGTDIDILSRPCISKSDVIIALMDSDADNLESCLYLKKNFGNKKAIAKVNNSKYIEKFERVGIDIAFSSSYISSNAVGSDGGKQCGA